MSMQVTSSVPTLQSLLDGLKTELAATQEDKTDEPVQLKPLDLNSIVNNANETIQEASAKVAPIRDKVNAANQSREELTRQISEQLKAQTAAQSTLAKIDADTSAKASKLNTAPIETYKKMAGSEQANQRRQQMYQELQDSQTAYQAVVDEMENSNFFMKAIIRENSLKHASERLRQAQSNLQVEQQIAAVSTSNLFQSLKANMAVAGNPSEEARAQATKDLQIASTMAKQIMTERNLKTEDLKHYAAELGLEETAVKFAQSQVNLAHDAKKLNDTKFLSIMQEAQAVSAVHRMERELKASKDKDDFHAVQDEDFQSFLSTAHPDKVDKLHWNTAIGDNMTLSNEMFVEYIAWQRTNGDAGHSYANAWAAQRGGNELTPKQQNLLAAGRSLAMQTNKALDKEMARLDLTTAAGQKKQKELEAQYLTVGEADAAKISARLEELNRESAVSANDAISSGIMPIADFKREVGDVDAMISMGLDTQEAVAIKELFASDAMKDIDLSIVGADPAAAVDGNMEQLTSGVSKMISDILSTNPNITPAVAESRAVGQTSEAIAKYYRAVRKANAGSIGFNRMDALKIEGVRTRESADWMSGLDTFTTINLENAGEIKTLLLNNLRYRKAQRKSAVSMMSNPVGL